MNAESSCGVMRPMVATLNTLTRSDGSCDLSQGGSTVIASVYGPTEARLNKELIDRAYVDVVYRPKIGLPSARDKLAQEVLEKTCESVLVCTLHPRTCVSVTVQAMETDGSLLACSINCMNLSLMDACVPMKYQLAAVGVAVTDGNIVTDPTLGCEESADATLTIVFESKRRDVVTVSTAGVFSPDMMAECIDRARDASGHVFQFYRETFQKKLMT